MRRVSIFDGDCMTRADNRFCPIRLTVIFFHRNANNFQKQAEMKSRNEILYHSRKLSTRPRLNLFNKNVVVFFSVQQLTRCLVVTFVFYRDDRGRLDKWHLESSNDLFFKFFFFEKSNPSEKRNRVFQLAAGDGINRQLRERVKAIIER